MSLVSGTRLGPYEVLSALGAGGMGEVYRARDTRLKRDVALKILPESFATDPDRLARFEREAQVLASLNHPLIAAIYGLEESGGTRALVMELVEGETLADRIARGPLPIDEALPIARQIAEALEAAHEQGIVHRDLKPANIKVRPDGTVKVLDFGLAKLNETGLGARDSRLRSASFGGQAELEGAQSISPTITSPVMTGVGVLLGTAAYMAPEQAKGHAAGKRSDIWAFGCVVYEMLTGRRVFKGDDVQETLAAVLRDTPDWSALPAGTPRDLQRLLRRCIERDRSRRLPDIGAARLEIDDVVRSPSGDDQTADIARGSSSRLGRALPWAIATALAVALALAMFAPWRSEPASSAMRLRVELGADVNPAVDIGAAVVLSPDGRTIAFAAQKAAGESQLFVRPLDQLEATPLAGTDGARNPFFSPDGQWLGFFADGKLKKISINGGAAVTLCDAPNGRGGSWTTDGTIVFTPNNTSKITLLRIPAAGGTPEPLTSLAEGEDTQRWPQVLRSGSLVLFTSSPRLTAWDDASIVVQRLPAGERKVVQRGGYYGRYLPSGHLVFMHDDTLFAVPFNLDRLEATGQAVPVLKNIGASAVTGGAQISFSDNGTLAYLPGRVSNLNNVPVFWMDRGGKTSPLRPAVANWTGLLFSPDGTRLAMDILDGQQRDIWVYETARDRTSRLTFDPADDVNPVWSPDGQRIAYGSKRSNKTFYSLYWQRADGSGSAQLLLEIASSHLIPGSWHPGGRYLAFHEIPQVGDSDLMILPLEGNDASGWKPGTPTVFLKTPASEQVPTFSPDGRWIAYYSNESGRNEVYVRPFPAGGGQWQISTGGGTYPTWSRTKPELFYASLDQHLMVVRYRVDGNSFEADTPALLNDTTFTDGQYRRFTLHPDGERFAIGKLPDASSGSTAVLVSNFFDELKRLAP